MSHEKLIHQQLLLSPSVKTSYVTRSLILDELEVLVPVIGTQTNVAYIRHQLLKWYCRPSSHYFLVGHSLYVTVYIYYIGLSVHLRYQLAHFSNNRGTPSAICTQPFLSLTKIPTRKKGKGDCSVQANFLPIPPDLPDGSLFLPDAAASRIVDLEVAPA